MKKTPLILAVLALVLSAAALVMTFVGKTGNISESEVVPGSTAVAGDIVYVQIDSLVMNYDMYNDLMTAFQSKLQASQDDLQKKSRKLETDMKSFENQINKGLLTRSSAEQQQSTLLQRQESLQNEANQKQLEFQEEEYVINNQILDAIQTYLKDYNAKHEYALIFTTSASTNVIIEGNKGLDITADVLSGLNNEYIQTRNN
ncbi:MAG: OmpH family outer membrane protein [Bacteroidales bacterium]|jgi:outer membrane protein|nr:OmpH family outer membrane protein [Bacteroidales bacterium]